MVGFGTLDVVRQRPMPSSAASIDAKRGYHEVAIAFGGAANAELLVDASAHGIAGQNYYSQPRNPPYYRVIPGSTTSLLVREGTARRLQAVNQLLASADLELFLFDGWRPQAVQAYFHDNWLPGEIRKRRPSISNDQLISEVQSYWAAPSTSREAPSPHSTGGAVDLTIRWRGADQLWMGSLFDDASPLAHTARFESQISSDGFSFSNEEARANRRLLYWLMTEAGFASNPSEWWHFSFGDQMWAKLRNEPQALYAGTE